MKSIDQDPVGEVRLPGIAQLNRLRASGALPGALTDDTIASLVSAAAERRYARGDEIYPDQSPCVGIVVEGVVRVYLQAWDGRQLTVRHRRPGAFCHKVALPGHRRFSVRFEAESDSTILEIPRPEFTSLVASRHDLALAVDADAVSVMEMTYATLGVNAFGTVRDRLVHSLLDLAERQPASSSAIVTSTQQQLADDVGSTREVVARALGELAADGLLVTGKGRIVIPEPARLADVVSAWTDPATWSVVD